MIVLFLGQPSCLPSVFDEHALSVSHVFACLRVSDVNARGPHVHCRRPRAPYITLSFPFLQKHTIFNFQNCLSLCFVCQACSVGASVVSSSDVTF